MSRKESKTLNKECSPVKTALLYLAIWEIVTMILWLFTAKLFVIYALFAVGFTVLYPVCTCWLCFRFARRFGVKWYLTPVMIAVSVVEYILLEEFSSVVPNFIVMTILCSGFASGIGSCFADSEAINAAKREKQLRKNKKRSRIQKYT